MKSEQALTPADEGSSSPAGETSLPPADKPSSPLTDKSDEPRFADALRAKALEEVHETSADARGAALAELKARIASYNGDHEGERHGLFGHGELKTPVEFWRADDDAFLIAMLRGAKYRVEKALRKVVAYSQYVQENKDWCLQPDLGLVARVFAGAFVILPERDVLGRRVWFNAIQKQLDLAEAGEGAVSPENQVKASFWVMQGVLGNDESVSLEGVVILQDMASVDLFRMNRVITQDVNKMALRLFNLYPWRLKRIAVFHQPRWIGILFALVSPLITGKMRGRIHLYGRNYARMHHEFGRASLPIECEGELDIVLNASVASALELVAKGFPELKADVDAMISSLPSEVPLTSN
jgi:CRAL/TRIO domain